MCSSVHPIVFDINILGYNFNYISAAYFVSLNAAPFYLGLRFNKFFNDFFILSFILIFCMLFMNLYLYIIHVSGDVEFFIKRGFVMGDYAFNHLINYSLHSLIYFIFGLLSNIIIKLKILNKLYKISSYIYLLSILFILNFLNYRIHLLNIETTDFKSDCSTEYGLGWINTLISLTNIPIFLSCTVLIIAFALRFHKAKKVLRNAPNP